MKRDWWPELWLWLGLGVMVWGAWDHGPRADFHFVVGFLAMVRGDVLAIRREIGSWVRL